MYFLISLVAGVVGTYLWYRPMYLWFIKDTMHYMYMSAMAKWCHSETIRKRQPNERRARLKPPSHLVTNIEREFVKSHIHGIHATQRLEEECNPKGRNHTNGGDENSIGAGVVW